MHAGTLMEQPGWLLVPFKTDMDVHVYVMVFSKLLMVSERNSDVQMPSSFWYLLNIERI